ncbi:MAG: DUF4166 domain-containing protein [Hyphomonadaceae bacterium]|nr:DUF4166 domain-containing protein [Hyphomonadaceae bacterium]
MHLRGGRRYGIAVSWREIQTPEVEQDLILFDGDCVLCSHWARFVHRRDKAMRFKFVAIQSEYGRSLAARFGIDAALPQTNVVVVGGRAHFKSDAALAILQALPGWSWTSLARLAPRTLRNALYDLIARNRYVWFGRKEQCWATDAAFKARIVDRGEVPPPRTPFEQALGPAFGGLAPAVQAAHQGGALVQLRGEAHVAGAASPVAAWLCSWFGLPRDNAVAAVRVIMDRRGAEEVWTRWFDDVRMTSRVRTLRPGFVTESLGVLIFEAKLAVEQGALVMTVVGLRIGPLRLPSFLAPHATAIESADSDGRFRFDVDIVAPLLGRLTHYRGWLELEEAEHSALRPIQIDQSSAAPASAR